MNLRISISPKNEKTAPQSDKQLKEDVRNAAELWAAGKKEEASAIFIDCFQHGKIPNASVFTPYIGKLGTQYCALIEKMYSLQTGMEDEEDLWPLLEFLEECPNNSLINTLTEKIVGAKWEAVQEKFYDKCPDCMFMGGADEPYSLKLRSPQVVECIPEGMALRELSGMKYMDGYSRYEGFALVKDDPDAKLKYPQKIQDILEKIKKRGGEHFPNLIFPLTQGKNILETCEQMLELLDLLDYGYHFENISTYIGNHPKLFKNIMKKRMSLLQSLVDNKDEDSEEDDEDFDFDDLDILFEGEDEKEPKSSGKKKNSKKKK